MSDLRENGICGFDKADNANSVQAQHGCVILRAYSETSESGG